MINNRVFRPKLAPTLGFLILFPGFISLGIWQLDRADQKEAVHSEYLENTALPRLDINMLDMDNGVDPLVWRKAWVEGSFLQEADVLLDNQVKNGVPGYFLYTPITLEDSSDLLLVNRGWLPAGVYRDDRPEFSTPAEIVSLTGVIKRPPSAGLLLDDELIDFLPTSVTRVQALSIPMLESVLDKKLFPVVLRLDNGSDHGYDRNWAAPGSGSERHMGYAFQWFLMAAVLCIIFVILNIKKPGAADV